jgi:hypothetical protein
MFVYFQTVTAIDIEQVIFQPTFHDDDLVKRHNKVNMTILSNTFQRIFFLQVVQRISAYKTTVGARQKIQHYCLLC